ncbi:MAG: TonB-dependent siderophore receptor [Rhodospirillales bacterium]|nr:TonB-dependent siderophore receptor [Rhodospirillales bacterium]
MPATKFGSAASLLAAALALGSTSAVLAQEPPLEAQASRTANFDIASQPLAQALTAFGRQSGVQIAVDTAAVAGKTSGAVSGTMTVEQALRQLLAGSGLTYQFTSANAVTVAGAAPGPGSSAVQLDPVRVQASAPPPQAEIGNLPPPFAGGQVARGGKVGLLGNRDFMDTPFSETTYTERYIQDQQARTLTDVLAGDPTVRLGWPNGNVFDDRAMIRGIFVTNPNYGLGGLYGIVPGQADTTGVERVEVFRGPSAFLNGALPSAVGGTINLVPKRATSEPITQASALYLSDAQLGGTVDIGRRFGPDQSVGLRANATYTSGDTAVNNQTAERLALTLGFDFRSDATRIDGDIGYLRRDVGAFQGSIFLAAGVQLPAPPYAARSSYQPWERLQADDLYGALRFEHDIAPWLTGFIKVGAKRANISTIFLNQNIVNYSGNTTTLSAGNFLQNTEVLSAETGLRGIFNTGPIKHEAALVGDYMKTQIWSFNNPLTIPTSSSIYNPTFIAAPSLFGLRNNAPLTSDSILSSIGLVDALSAADDRIQLIVGARAQRLQNANYSAVTGLPTSGNDKSVVSPSASFVVKPTKEFMFYGNYIQALQPGPVAGPGTTNAGQTFAPFVTTQFELGAKVDFGTLAATLSAFQITIPSAFTDLSTNTFVVDGQQRNRGLEFVVFGEPLPGLKLLGGFTLLEAIQTTTAGGLNNGKVAVGTAPFQFSLGADWDTPFAKGFGVMGRVVYNGQVYLNAANTQAAPPWTRFDAGLRYTFEGPQHKPLTVRANVINLFDANYWVATTAFFAQNQPRTFMLSLTADF